MVCVSNVATRNLKSHTHVAGSEFQFEASLEPRVGAGPPQAPPLDSALPRLCCSRQHPAEADSSLLSSPCLPASGRGLGTTDGTWGRRLGGGLAWLGGGGCFINREAHQAGGVTDAPGGLDGAGKSAPNALRVWALTAALSSFFFVPTCLQSVLSQEARQLPLPALRGSEMGLHRPCGYFSLQAGKAGGQWSARSERPGGGATARQNQACFSRC